MNVAIAETLMTHLYVCSDCSAALTALGHERPKDAMIQLGRQCESQRHYPANAAPQATSCFRVPSASLADVLHALVHNTAPTLDEALEALESGPPPGFTPVNWSRETLGAFGGRAQERLGPRSEIASRLLVAIATKEGPQGLIGDPMIVDAVLMVTDELLQKTGGG